MSADQVPGAAEAPTGILRLAAPLVVSFWLRSAFNLVDSIYASQLPGLPDQSLAAIGLAVPFEFLMIACWVGTSNGLTSRLSAAMGAGQDAKIEQLKRASLKIIGSLVGIFWVFAALAWVFAGSYHPDPETVAQFRIYITIVLAGSGVTAFWSILPDSLVKAHHDTRSTMWAGLIGAFSNLILNTVFVFVFEWGIAGIALATVLARVFGLSYAIMRARHHEALRQAAATGANPEVFERPVRVILFLAVPSGIAFVLMAVESLVINKFLGDGPNSTATVAAWGIFDRGVRFMSMPLIAISVAMLPYSARLWGQGRIAEIGSGMRTALLAGLGFVLFVVTPTSLLLAPWIAREMSDAESTRAAMQASLYFLPAAVLVFGPGFLFRSAFEGMQHPRPGLITAILRSVVLVVPLTWIGVRLAPEWGALPITGACIGFGIGVAATSAFLGFWLRRYLKEETALRQVRANT